METIADLHLHSHYSIATGRLADLEHLDLWGRYKGLHLVGTGDCTHPQWLKEMAARMEPLAEGTYVLKKELALPLEPELRGPSWQEAPRVRFVVTGEVSAIYKKAGRVRKVHLLLLLPSLEAAQQLSERLARLGNVASDGRPILGLDAKYLLELVLAIDPRSLVIPAHIWTPWFSVLGSKSGFDSLEECFEDGLAHIYALETGLSSDPAMNWRVGALDRFTLVSNSDAHSPQKLGREANLLTVPPTYADLSRALRTREGFAGTLEFFPEEGKYHLDGHRHCGQRLNPEEAAALQGCCPGCGKPLTLGVLHRVEDLADRPPGASHPEARPYESLISLSEVLAQVLQVGPASLKVRQRYFRLLAALGPELTILRRAPLEDLAREGGEHGPLLARAVDKVRRGQVHIAGGYDGEYGEIRLFTPEERRQLQGQGAFFSLSAAVPATPPAREPAAVGDRGLAATAEPSANCKPKIENPLLNDALLGSLNRAQRHAVTYVGPALVVAAGPGSGKTRALTHRLAYLVSRRGVPPQEILALTFTRQAAGEMADRLTRLLPDFPGLEGLTIKTFHALGHQLLLDQGGSPRQVAVEEHRRHLLRQVARDHQLPWAALEKQVTSWKQALKYPKDLREEEAGEPGYLAAYRSYEAALETAGLWDYEDLIARPTLLLERQPEVRESLRRRFRHLLVDEYQDLNEAQYRMFRWLAGPGAEIMVIGDPDQAIYGFRGASPRYFSRFLEDWPQAQICRFEETYRLPEPILQAAQRLQASGPEPPQPMTTNQPGTSPLILLEAANPQAEARAIAREIENLVGGMSHLALEDRDLRYQDQGGKASFRDIAVLYRLHALGPELERTLKEAGIPCQQPREGVGPDWDGLDLAAERVKLLSLHAAKGLEFPYVFIAGCEEGLIPWEPPGGLAADPDEERRLFYVGLTRASRQLFLTWARQRNLWGRRRPSKLSPWVRLLPADLLTRPAAAADLPRPPRARPLFPEMAPPRGNKRG
ncbi:MAG: UvrD-helicase domain-containing protein [Desulfobaccales bacterium]